MGQNKRHFRPEECCELNDIQIHVLAASPTVTLHGAIVMTRSLSFCFLVRSLLPTQCRCRELLYLITLIDTNTLSRTPLDGRSASRRDSYLTAHNIQEKTEARAAGGIRNGNPSKRAAVSLHLRPHSHRGRLSNSRQIRPSVSRASDTNVVCRMGL